MESEREREGWDVSGKKETTENSQNWTITQLRNEAFIFCIEWYLKKILGAEITFGLFCRFKNLMMEQKWEFHTYICRPVPQMWKFLWKWKIESESHIVNQFPRCHQFNFFTVGGRIPFCQIETSLSKVLSNLMFTGRLHDSCSRWRASPRYLLAKG